MIKNIVKILPLVGPHTEAIHIAKGKNKLPVSFKEGFKQIKLELDANRENN